MTFQQDSFALANFEGSLEFLLCLIQKEEIAIYDIPIQELMQQFIKKLTEWENRHLEKGAEFIGTAAYLVWLKSKTLLPLEERYLDPEESLEDPHFEIIHHLIDYCRFKQTAKELIERQNKEQGCYFRGISLPISKKPLGLQDVSLNELEALFQELMKRAPSPPALIQEESWRVSDKMCLIRQYLQEFQTFSFMQLFSSIGTRLEMIVSFLALLELMKIGEVGIARDAVSEQIVVFSKAEEK